MRMRVRVAAALGVAELDNNLLRKHPVAGRESPGFGGQESDPFSPRLAPESSR